VVLAALRERAGQELAVAAEQELHPACVASPGRRTTLLIGSDMFDLPASYTRQVPHQFHHSLSVHLYRQHYRRSLQAVTQLGGSACMLKALAALSWSDLASLRSLVRFARLRATRRSGDGTPAGAGQGGLGGLGDVLNSVLGAARR
jgi:hypothetical protein